MHRQRLNQGISEVEARVGSENNGAVEVETYVVGVEGKHAIYVEISKKK